MNEYITVIAEYDGKKIVEPVRLTIHNTGQYGEEHVSHLMTKTDVITLRDKLNNIIDRLDRKPEKPDKITACGELIVPKKGYVYDKLPDEHPCKRCGDAYLDGTVCRCSDESICYWETKNECDCSNVCLKHNPLVV